MVHLLIIQLKGGGGKKTGKVSKRLYKKYVQVSKAIGKRRQVEEAQKPVAREKKFSPSARYTSLLALQSGRAKPSVVASNLCRLMLQMVHLAPTFPIGQAIQRTGKAAVSPHPPRGKKTGGLSATHSQNLINQERSGVVSRDSSLQGARIMARLLILLCCISLPPRAFSRLH